MNTFHTSSPLAQYTTPVATICVMMPVLLLLLITGCTTPPVHTMVDADFIGDRTVKYMLLDPGRSRTDAATEEDLPSEFHFSVRICDLGEDRQEINCEDSIVLRRVGLNPDPESHSTVDAQREVTNLFWYTSEILYVSYLERKRTTSFGDQQYVWEPRVQMCSIDEHNSLYCQPQQALNQILTITE